MQDVLKLLQSEQSTLEEINLAQRRRKSFTTLETILLLHPNLCQVQFSEYWNPELLCNGQKAVDIARALVSQKRLTAR